MSSMAKAARAAMKAKASRMGGKGDPKAKVDASTWTPPEMMNTEAKTGMRPLTRRAFKKGGKVVGKCEGGPAKVRADRMKRKTGGRSLVTDLINRNAKKANEEREGGKAHVGGLKRGGRAHKLYGGGFEEKVGTKLPYAMKNGGRRKRADGGPLYDVSGSSELYTRDQSTGNAARDLARISRARSRAAEDNPSYNPGNAGPAYTPANYSAMDFGAARDAARAKFEAGNGPSTFAWNGREYGFDATGPAAAPRRAAPPPIQASRMTDAARRAEEQRMMDINAAPQTEPAMQGPRTEREKAVLNEANAEPGRYLPPSQVPGVSGEGGGLPRPVPPGGGGLLNYGGLPSPARPGGGLTGQGGLPSPARPGGGLLGMGGFPSTRRAAPQESVGFVPERQSRDLAQEYGYGRPNAGRDMVREYGGYKRGGSVGDEAQDKKMIKKALRQHDKNMHGGKREEIKLKKGGKAKKQAGGIAGDAPTRGYRPGATATDDQRTLAPRRPLEQPTTTTVAPRRPAEDPTTTTIAPRNPKKKGGGTYFGGTRPTGGRMPKADGGEADKYAPYKENDERLKNWPKVPQYDPKRARDMEGYYKEQDRQERSFYKSPKRKPRKAGGRAKGKTNIVIAINPQQGGQQGPMPQMGPTPRPVAPMPVAPPGMPGGAPQPGMGAMPPGMGGGMPAGMPGMPGMPPGMPPMPRKSGGRAYRSYKDMDAGALSGMGRLEKTEIEHGKRVGRLSGGRARSYKDMDAGSLGGMGRIEKTAIQKNKR